MGERWLAIGVGVLARHDSLLVGMSTIYINGSSKTKISLLVTQNIDTDLIVVLHDW